MASIEKLPSGRYRVVWYEGIDKLRRAAPDYDTARKLKLRIEQDLSLHGRVTIDDPRPRARPLHEALTAWLDAVRLDLTPRTHGNYEDATVLFLDAMSRRLGVDAAALDVTVLNREALVGFSSWLIAEGRTSTTALKRAQTLRLAWLWLYEGETDGPFLKPPPAKAAGRRAPLPSPIAPTWREADACLDAMHARGIRRTPHDWLFRFGLLARYTGLRRSELIRVLWTDLELDGFAPAMTIRAVITKGQESGRRVPLAPALAAILRTWDRPTPYVVAAPPAEVVAAEGKGRGHVDRNLRRAWVRAGVRPEVWTTRPAHAFRRGLRTGLEELRIRTPIIDYLVGHKPVGTGPRHYLDSERAYWPELVEAVNALPVYVPRVGGRVVAMRNRSTPSTSHAGPTTGEGRG